MTSPPPMDTEHAQKLPSSLEEAVQALEKDDVMVEALGKRFVSWYVTAKRDYEIRPFTETEFSSEEEKMKFERESAEGVAPCWNQAGLNVYRLFLLRTLTLQSADALERTDMEYIVMEASDLDAVSMVQCALLTSNSKHNETGLKVYEEKGIYDTKA
nr:hypothetical protein BaRGS_004859 [Batillaria attramentaria]